MIGPIVMEAAPAPPFSANRSHALGEVRISRAASLVEPDRRVDISPANAVDRTVLRMNGLTIDLVRARRREKFECRFRAASHLLVFCEQGSRSNGDTFVTGLPPSSLRELKKKLTFVPAGREYYEWHEPRTLSRITYFYFDPTRMPIDAHHGFTDFAPRLYFEDAALWELALKLSVLAERQEVCNGSYTEALGVILAHELVRLNSQTPSVRAPIRGGLAAWQQRLITSYIEDHLADQISLNVLAGMVRLSPCHFCRAFKQSFGMPPHRFHTHRRIERAKAMLADVELSVTEIALAVGFGETSSFSTVFRKATGLAPTEYRRNLVWPPEAYGHVENPTADPSQYNGICQRHEIAN